MFKKFIFILSLLSLISCERHEDVLFISPSNTGITFINSLENNTSLNILNYLYFYNGSGVAIGDFNNDSLEDIYFTGNSTSDHLYLNKGNLTFKNITEQSSISNKTGWTTGVTTVDINNDGLLDIYVCKVSNYLSLRGHNLLYVNQGVKNNTPVFKELSKEYGLNFSGLSTQASFFDADLDGDLDLFLMNHSIKPNLNYGKGNLRKKIDSLSGDKFYINNNGIYTDTSKESGIFQGRIGYGLGLSTGDLNNDGYPDIYVGNDFFENDYVYINQHDGTFKEINSTQSVLGHSSHFTMGTDIVDVNNDGFFDIFTVDMLPENIENLKTSGAEYSYPIYKNRLRNGYESQFMQNTLHLNQGGLKFSESAFASGIAATEWSWSPLVADFDNDGLKDLYITNGVKGATNDMDFINFIANANIQKRLNQGVSSRDLILIEEIPERPASNYFFKNIDGKHFENKSNIWKKEQDSYSNGASYADLDNDGDLDVVVNNINSIATILENTINKTSETNFLKIKFKGSSMNAQGIGAKVICYAGSTTQYFENYPTRGYLSSVPSSVFVGLSSNTKIDSLKIIWPLGEIETLYNVSPNITLTVDQVSATFYDVKSKSTSDTLLSNIPSLLNYRHIENSTLDFDRIPLTPYSQSSQSTIFKIGDLNNDKKDDILTLGAKGSPSQIYLQNNNRSPNLFDRILLSDFDSTSINEDIDAIIFDANNDKQNDLLIVSGGNEFKKGLPLQPRLYLYKEGHFIRDKTSFQDVSINASKITTIDFDNDGDLDICITSDAVPLTYGETPRQYFFENDGKGNFKNISNSFGENVQNLGNIRDMKWIDLNKDETKDVIFVGHWMAPSIFFNEDGKLVPLKDKRLLESKGWWNTVIANDFDNDGDVDFIAGNWGLNTRLKASVKEPMKLYLNDFDNNNTIDPIISYVYQGKETIFATKDELGKQLPFINKKFLSYKSFAKGSIKEILGSDKIVQAQKKEINELASTYFRNNGDNSFTKTKLPFQTQLSTVNDMIIEDFNQDGLNDILLVGNEKELNTQLGKLDASHGTILINNKGNSFYALNSQLFKIPGVSKKIQSIMVRDKEYFIVGRNNDSLLFLKKHYD